jgi:hypothetical protein
MQAQLTPKQIHNATGTVAASVPDAADRKPTTDELAASGLVELIQAFNTGCEAFSAGSPEQTESAEFVKSTYGNHYDALKKWVGPAKTRAEALAALRFADGELANDDDDLVLAMVHAARTYFEQDREPSQTSSTSSENVDRAEIIDREKRLLLRTELDNCLSLLDVAVHALRCEHDYHQHQTRPLGLPHMGAVIKTLEVCASSLEECWSELKLSGDVDYERKLWRPDRRGRMV